MFLLQPLESQIKIQAGQQVGASPGTAGEIAVIIGILYFFRHPGGELFPLADQALMGNIHFPVC